ncbi:MAG: hypothetical protein HQL32_00910 [Planctomycetes bacterium]|nr:hypothetical protein [Planctomycetota bacterium]
MKRLLSEYLLEEKAHELFDSSFLATAKSNDYKCPVHHLPLLIEEGYKAKPDRSLSQMPAEQSSDYPYAVCWSRGFEPEKHGPIEPAPIVYCAMCNKMQKEDQKIDEEERKRIFSDREDEIYRV